MLEETLTEHERDLLRLVALGYSNELIAHQLGLKVHSATLYVYRLRCKLHLENRAQMVTYALREGCVVVRDIPHPYELGGGCPCAS